MQKYSGQGLTAGEYNVLKEQKLQEWRAKDIQILDIRNEIKDVEIETEYVNLEIAQVGLEIAQVNRESRLVDLEVANINLEAHTLDIDIANERLLQKQDELTFEQFQTNIKRENYLVQANTQVTQLEMAVQQLDELLDLGQLQHRTFTPALNTVSFS